MPRSGAKTKGPTKTNRQNSKPAARPSSGPSPSSASTRTRGKQSEKKGTPPASAGAGQSSVTASKGKQSAGMSSTSGALSVKGKQLAAVSTDRSGDASGKMSRRKPDEEMDWEHTPETGESKRSQPASTSFKPIQFKGTDHKAATSPSAATAMSPAGHRDQGSSVDGGQGGHTPSAAGGEGQQNDSSDSMDSDLEDYECIPSEEEKRMEKPSKYDANRPWKGVPLSKLKTTPECLPPDLKLERSAQHFVAVRLPFEYKENQTPGAFLAPGRWDTEHVRMPNVYDSKCVRNGKEERRWDVIVKALKGPIPGPFELEEAILKYNQRYINKWKFTVLHHFFIKHVSNEEREQFFENLLPEMIHLAVRLPDICPLPIPLLTKGKARKLTLSQYQISCLLANAFFCTFPLRNSRTRASEYSDYPDINFCHLFVGDPVQRKLQKLQCVIHYFKRVLFRPPAGIVTFSRQVLASPYNWHSSMDNLSLLHVSSTGTIEDNGEGMLQVDFANKYIGGGVLGHGCVQEEIRFMICPEMIITRLFTQSLDYMESLIMTGCERFSEYEGYSDTFRWKGDYTDTTPRDYLGRLCCEVVAIDAQVFRSDYNKQFKRSSIERELNKAYCGFKTSANKANTPAVCTGNWGCGAFGGDKQLKALIQVMAASVAKRDVCYFTFDDEQLAKDLFGVHDHLRRKAKTVGDVYRLLEDYNRMVLGGRRSHNTTLFDFIHSQLARDVPVSRPRSSWDDEGYRNKGSSGDRMKGGSGGDWFSS